MADSFEDLGTTPIWYPANIINWRKGPGLNFDIEKKIHEYQGTAQDFLLYGEETPRKWDFEVLNDGKQAEYELLYAFIFTYQARKKRFWFPLPLMAFELYEVVLATSTTVTVYDNGLEFKGWERFFMELKNGDKITRHVTAIERFGNNTIVLTVSAMPNIDIYPEDVAFFSFLPLCRFDQDAIKPKFSNCDVSVATVKLTELLEHSEV